MGRHLTEPDSRIKIEKGKRIPMTEPVRVLHVVGKLNRGGAESRIMDLYRNIDRAKVQFDFVEHTNEHCAFEDEIESLGGRIYRVERFKVYNWIAYQRDWKKLLKEHPEWKVVHGHMTSTAGIYLPLAKKMIQCYTIAHARSAGVDPGIKGKLTRWLRRNLKDQCDQCYTCSALAGESVFGKKAMELGMVEMIPNAIEADKFQYNQAIREEYRRKLQIDDSTLVLGHVGRIDPVKNHPYMLEILEQMCEQGMDVKLLLLGEGSQTEMVKALAKAKHLEEKVLFAGNHKNVWDYYQAMDFFLLPSFYEGLPGTAVEAQAAGLRGILSDTITREAAVTELMTYRSIEEPAAEWVKEILARKDYERENTLTKIKASGFDVKALAEKLQSVYLSV